MRHLAPTLAALRHLAHDVRHARTNAATLAAARAAAYITPEHRYIDKCDQPDTITKGQQADRMARVANALGIPVADATAVEHRLHPASCWSCHSVDTDEEYRVVKRRLHAWAGVPVPAALAADGPDVLQPGDADLVWSVLGDDFETWQVVTPRAAAAAGLPHFHHARYGAAIRALVADGRAQTRDISARRTQHEPVAP